MFLLSCSGPASEGLLHVVIGVWERQSQTHLPSLLIRASPGPVPAFVMGTTSPGLFNFIVTVVWSVTWCPCRVGGDAGRGKEKENAEL